MDGQLLYECDDLKMHQNRESPCWSLAIASHCARGRPSVRLPRSSVWHVLGSLRRARPPKARARPLGMDRGSSDVERALYQELKELAGLFCSKTISRRKLETEIGKA